MYVPNCLSNSKNIRSMLHKACKRLRARELSTVKSPKIPECEYTPSTYEGTSYEKLRDFYVSRVSPTAKQYYKRPLLLHEGRAQWLWDHNGKRYLDMFGGIATISVGHGHPKISAVMGEQASKLNHISAHYMHPRQYEYIEKLIETFPKKLNVVYLTNSGSEANDLAFLMARLYTQANDIVSLRNSYHGGSYGPLASTAMSSFKYPISQLPGHIHATNPDVYRGHWGCSRCRDCPVTTEDRKCICEEGECRAVEKYIQELEDIFRFSLPNGGRLAAFIAEGIQGVGGVVQYPRSYLKKAHDLVHRNGGLCIVDEVQSGLGRTGEHFWAFEGHQVVPDIVTTAKGLGNGFPVGAVITSSEIAESLGRAFHANTFGGNPVACAVASTVLDIIEEERLQENARLVGTYMLHRLSTLALDFPNVIGDVRGKGLMIGLELIEDRETRKHLRNERTLEIFEDIKDMGVLVGKGGAYANVLRIMPPLCVTREDADFTVEVIKAALHRHRDRHLNDKESVFFGSV